MEIISSKLVSEASELPSVVLALTAAIGPLMWVLGWRIHRALFVAASTLIGGMYGLAHGPSLGLYPVIAAGLLSVSAGGLAMAMLRIGVFVVFGAVMELAVRATIAKQMNDDAQVWLRGAAFFAGGLLSLACYRFLMIALMSFAGAFLLMLGGMAFAVRHGEFDTIAWADEHSRIVTAVWVGLGILGIVGQYILERQHARHKKERSHDPALDLLRKVLKSKSSSH
jgi:hypothetical protein